MDPNFNPKELNESRELFCGSCGMKADCFRCNKNVERCFQKMDENSNQKVGLKESEALDAIAKHIEIFQDSTRSSGESAISSLVSSRYQFPYPSTALGRKIDAGISKPNTTPFAPICIPPQHLSQVFSGPFANGATTLQQQPNHASPLMVQHWLYDYRNESMHQIFFPQYPSHLPLFPGLGFASPTISLESQPARVIDPYPQPGQNSTLARNENDGRNTEHLIKINDDRGKPQITEDRSKVDDDYHIKEKKSETQQPSMLRMETKSTLEYSRQNQSQEKAVMPITETTEKPNSQKKTKRKAHQKRSVVVSRNKPKRSLTAYNLFFKDEREKLLKERCHKESVGFKGMAQIISARWRNLDPKCVVKYQALATADKKRYENEMKEFKALKDEQLSIIQGNLFASVDEITRRKYFDQN